MKSNKIVVPFIFLLFLCGCNSHPPALSIEGDYVITNSAIFLTSMRAEKEDLFTSCVSKKVTIRGNKLFADTTCGLFDQVNTIIITDSFTTTANKFPIQNPDRFSYFMEDSTGSHSQLLVFKAHSTFSYGKNDSLYIVKKSADTILVVQDPFVVMLSRNKGKQG